LDRRPVNKTISPPAIDLAVEKFIIDRLVLDAVMDARSKKAGTA